MFLFFFFSGQYNNVSIPTILRQLEENMPKMTGSSEGVTFLWALSLKVTDHAHLTDHKVKISSIPKGLDPSGD